MMKKWMILFDVIVLIIAVSAGILFIQNYNRTQSKEEIRIGVIESLSGNAAYYGDANRKGVELAKSELQAKYPNLIAEVIHEDSQYTAQGGVAAYRKIKELQKIDAVITHASPVSLAIQPLANNDRILQMAVSSSARTYSSSNDLSFRTSPTTDIEAETLADFLDGRYENLSILYMNNDIGLSIAGSLKAMLKKINSPIVIVEEESFSLDNTDFRTQLLKIKEKGADVVFVPALASHISLMLRQSKENNITVQFVGFRSTEDPQLLKNAGELAEGVIYSYGFDTSGSEEANRFSASYEARYGENPDGYAAEGYEGLRLTVLALASCNKNIECAKSYLHNLKDYNSVFGNLSFDENGDVYYKFFLKTIRNGTFVRYP